MGMGWGWLGRKWKLVVFSPLLLFAFSMPVSVVFMIMHDFNKAVAFARDVSSMSQVLGGFFSLLYVSLGALNKQLRGVPRVPWWVMPVSLVPYVAGLAYADLLSMYAERGVFFMPVMTEAYVATALFYLGASATDSLAVLIGLYAYGALNRAREKEEVATPTKPKKKHAFFTLTDAVIYGAGTADAVLVTEPLLRALFIALLVLYTAFIIARLVMRTKVQSTAVKRATARLFLYAFTFIVLSLVVAFIVVTINTTAPFIGSVMTMVGTGLTAKNGASLVVLLPAGIEYRGPATTTLAGYYCIEGVNSSNGYSIQLNALLNNGLWVQNAYALVPANNSWRPEIIDDVWAGVLAIHVKRLSLNATCAWLFIAVKNGYVYFGYGLGNITWFDKYSALGAEYIVRSGATNIVLAGHSGGSTAWLGNGTLVYLALYYWNGTTWAPAPVAVLRSHGGTAESVDHAYVFTSGICGGVVSWGMPIAKTTCPPTPKP
jgi:hypothetical protein